MIWSISNYNFKPFDNIDYHDETPFILSKMSNPFKVRPIMSRASRFELSHTFSSSLLCSYQSSIDLPNDVIKSLLDEGNASSNI